MRERILTLHSDDSAYPRLLKETVGFPKTLHYIGSLPTSEEICVSIVGTRKATREGLAIAHETAKEIAKRGFTIVSGLALGIDGAAHEGALAGKGKTVAVLANGLDSVYPKQHENLAKLIIENGGCIISEYSDGTPSYPNQFLERNRIVSGLSIATIVIEAPERSGSLATARNAIEQGREVFIFPGSVNHVNYRGSHRLIRDGARLVTNFSDILEDLGMSDKTPREQSLTKITELEDENEIEIVRTLLESPDSITIDKIIELTILPPHIVSEKLTLLIFDGIVSEQNGLFSISS
ncbi:MAG: DNA-processing protein DprA [bacterium]